MVGQTNEVPYFKGTFDTINVTYPDTVTEVYTYKQGGSTVGVITVVYTDATKEVLSSVVKA